MCGLRGFHLRAMCRLVQLYSLNSPNSSQPPSEVTLGLTQFPFLGQRVFAGPHSLGMPGLILLHFLEMLSSIIHRLRRMPGSMLFHSLRTLDLSQPTLQLEPCSSGLPLVDTHGLRGLFLQITPGSTPHLSLIIPGSTRPLSLGRLGSRRLLSLAMSGAIQPCLHVTLFLLELSFRKLLI